MAFRSNSLVRIVSGDKTVQGKLLNVCGAQVVRTSAARVLYNLRSVTIPELVRDEVDELRREGVVVLPDFLPRHHFEQLQQDALALIEQNREMANLYRHGPNTVHHLTVASHFDKSKTWSIFKFLDDARIRGILQSAEKRTLSRLEGKLEHVHQGLGPEHDPESDLHSDIFFHTHKAWLYLHNVEEEHGPLVYVKRSHRLSTWQLYYAYRESCTRNGGSRRITPAEAQRLGLEESIMTCRENTLVVANVCGFHRRLRGKPGRDRHAVQVSLRFNPFTLWLGQTQYHV